jgi:hypothetical protein
VREREGKCEQYMLSEGDNNPLEAEEPKQVTRTLRVLVCTCAGVACCICCCVMCTGQGSRL